MKPEHLPAFRGCASLGRCSPAQLLAQLRARIVAAHRNLGKGCKADRRAASDWLVESQRQRLAMRWMKDRFSASSCCNRPDRYPTFAQQYGENHDHLRTAAVIFIVYFTPPGFQVRPERPHLACVGRRRRGAALDFAQRFIQFVLQHAIEDLACLFLFSVGPFEIDGTSAGPFSVRRRYGIATADR